MTPKGVMPGRPETGRHLALGFQKRVHRAQNGGRFREVLKCIQGNDDVGEFLCALSEGANVVYARLAGLLPSYSQDVLTNVNTDNPFRPTLR